MSTSMYTICRVSYKGDNPIKLPVGPSPDLKQGLWYLHMYYVLYMYMAATKAVE